MAENDNRAVEYAARYQMPVETMQRLIDIGAIK